MKRKICHTGDWEDYGTWNLYSSWDFQSTGWFSCSTWKHRARLKGGFLYIRVLEVWLLFQGLMWTPSLINMGKSKWCQSAEGKIMINHDFFGVSHGVSADFQRNPHVCEMWQSMISVTGHEILEFARDSIWIFLTWPSWTFRICENIPNLGWVVENPFVLICFISFFAVKIIIPKDEFSDPRGWKSRLRSPQPESCADLGTCRYHNYGIALVNRL